MTNFRSFTLCLILYLCSFELSAGGWATTYNTGNNVGWASPAEACLAVAGTGQSIVSLTYSESKQRYTCFYSTAGGSNLVARIYWYEQLSIVGVCTQNNVDPANGYCDAPPSCLEQKPITSAINLSQGCFNSCQYQNLGSVQDFSNALSSPEYEYVPSGTQCTAADQSIDSANEYQETNNDGLDCRTSTSAEICIDESHSCKLINGTPSCINNQTLDEENYCGTYNGQVVCFPKNQQTNCGFVNGEYLCAYFDGSLVDNSTPDHPGNGGNGDGNPNNDALDQQDITSDTPLAQDVKKAALEGKIQQQVQRQDEKDQPKSIVTGEGCDKSVSCTGDAIQCAMLRLEKKRFCKNELNASDIKSIIDGNPLMSPLGSLASDNLTIDVESLLETEDYVSADEQCPEPLGFAVMGNQFAIDLTLMCDFAGYISYFILFCTWFSMTVLIARSLTN